MISILLITLLSITILQFSIVQTFVTKRIANYLSKELNAEITLDRVYLKPFSTLEIQNLKWKDKNGKTILAIGSLESSFLLHQLLASRVQIDEIKIEQGDLNIEIFKDSTNISSLINYFSPSTTDKTKSNSPIELKLNRVELVNNNFTLVNHNYNHSNKGIDFSDIEVTAFSAAFEDINIDSVYSAHIVDFKLNEKSGLVVKELHSKVSYSPTNMEFTDLYLATNRSTLQDYVRLDYADMEAFSNFIQEVSVTADLSKSYISSKDIEYFAPSMKSVQFETAVEQAKLSGTVANIRAQHVHLKTAKETELKGNFSIKGLPNINSTQFDVNLFALTTNIAELEQIIPQLTNQQHFRLPSQLIPFGKTTFSGNLTGLYDAFKINGLFHTELGEIQTTSDLNIKNTFKYSGQVQSPGFDIGKIVGSETIKHTGFNINFDGTGLSTDMLVLNFTGTLSNTNILNYNYEDIVLNGEIVNNTLNLTGKVNDKNLLVDFNSAIDWQKENPNYLLNADISYAAPNKLYWIDKDSIIIQRASINTNLKGNSLNSLEGHLDAHSIQMSTSKGNFEIKSIDFNAIGDEKSRTLTLQSDVVDAQIKGTIDLNTILPYFRSLAMRYAPASAIEVTPYNPQNFNLTLNIKSFKPIAALIDPSLDLDDGAYLNADFSSENYTAEFSAYSPTVTYKGMKLTELTVKEVADDHAFSLLINADRLSFADSSYVNYISIHNRLANDSLRFTLEMSKPEATNYLKLNGNIHFAYNAPALIKFQESTIILNKEDWSLNEDALMRISKGKIYISNLLFKQGQQQVKFDGIISNENDALHIEFDKFSLASLHGITNPLGINLRGYLNGSLALNSILKNPYASANIQTTPIIYNEIPIGQLALNADFDPATGVANLGLNLLDNAKRGATFTGTYNFQEPQKPLNLSGNLNEIDLVIFQPFLSNLITNLHGRANAEVTIVGSLINPKIAGIGRISSADFDVNYLKTPFHINNQLALVENNSIIFQNFSINDVNGKQAKANGIINLEKLANPYLDIDIMTDNVMIMNTTFKDNNLYYGTAYTTGNFAFKGYTSAIEIDINAKSETGTVINIPFNNAMTVTESDFIYFISKDSTENQKREKRFSFNGLTMNMDLNLTPNAEVNLQTNLGSLKGNGNGAITMKISSLGDFEMFGDYVVNNGKFHFTAQDFFNKFFDIKEGGTVRWTGKPSEAIINLTALYQQRTAIRPLYNAAGREGEDERVLAQADMLIKGTLEQPDISFDLNFPQNPYIKDQLQSYLSDVNNVNQQALSLIVRRSFTPNSTEQIGREVNNTLLSAGAEIAFNQLNNIISQSLNVNFFDLNIRSFNDASASVRLWDDRLVLTGGIADRSNYLANDLTFFKEGFTTDAELTYRLRKDGSLTMRAYNRPYTRNFLLRANDAEYISALGLVYRQEFNSINEFWRKLWTWGGIKKEDKPKEKK